MAIKIRVRAWPASARLAMGTFCLALAGCGGGDGGETAIGRPATAASAADAVPLTAGGAARLDAPTDLVTTSALVPAPPQVIDATTTGERVVKAVGALDGGGHAVVWMSRDPGVDAASWALWLQRFDARGDRVGEVVRLDYQGEVAGPQDLAVTVLPEGRIGVTFVTDRVEDVAFAITEVHHWPFNLEGSIDGMVRVLDAERYARFSPRFARLASPVTAAAGRDGSQFVAWRYQIVGAAPLAPSVRAQRLAADGEPLGWIQRLNGAGSFSRVLGVRITPPDEGGWIIGQERVAETGVRYQTFVQLDIARPLALPPGDVQPPAAFLLDLRGHGSVLFTRPLDLVTGELGPPRQIRFNLRGEAGPSRSLERIPDLAVALRGGDYVTLEPRGAVLVGQRYAPAGDPMGTAFETAAAGATAIATGLRRDGMVLAWVATRADGQVQVLSQRLSQREP